MQSKVAQRASDATAFPHRSALFLLQYGARWGDGSQTPDAFSKVYQLHEELAPLLPPNQVRAGARAQACLRAGGTAQRRAAPGRVSLPALPAHPPCCRDPALPSAAEVLPACLPA